MRSLIIAVFIFLFMVFSVVAEVKNASFALLRSYYEFGINEEVEAACDQMRKGLAEEDRVQVKDVFDTWQREQMNGIRQALEKKFGADAQQAFSGFVTEYCDAEKNGDAEYLRKLEADLEISNQFKDYKDLKSYAADALLASALENASVFLGDIETWISIGAKGGERPSLKAWVSRNSKEVIEQSPVKNKKKSLRGMEASAGEFKSAGADADVNPLDTLSKTREEKRAKAMNDAQAGMAMVAAERQAAEQEYAAKKLAQAKVEADAQVAQAKRLAAAEAEAIEQRQHTWGARLKNIVGATVSAAGGAFMGHVGAEAGRQAVNAIFD